MREGQGLLNAILADPALEQAIHIATAPECQDPECPCYQRGRRGLVSDIARERRAGQEGK